jgi:hypothetical protein
MITNHNNARKQIFIEYEALVELLNDSTDYGGYIQVERKKLEIRMTALHNAMIPWLYSLYGEGLDLLDDDRVINSFTLEKED